MSGRNRTWIPLPVWLGVLAIAAAVYVVFMFRSPSVVLLASNGPARWIRPDLQLSPQVRLFRNLHVAYRTIVSLPPGLNDARIQVDALQTAKVAVDHIELPRHGAPPVDWKQPDVRSFQPGVAPGTHELRVDVLNPAGPALVRVSCPALSIYSGPGWEWSGDDGKTWSPAATADEPEPYNGLGAFSPTPRKALGLAAVPLLLMMMTGVLLGSGRPSPTPGRIRLALILAWLLLAGVDMRTVGTSFGFDILPHLDYLEFVAVRHRLPLGTEGWQLFQAPLFYLVTWPLWAALRATASPHACAVAVRVVPIVCGGVMIELVYRSLREVFPGRDDLQRVGLVVGGLLPVNLYMMQFPSNEPFMAVVAAAMVWSVCRWLMRPNLQRPWRPAALTGTLLGLAVLSKVSAVIWIAPVALALAMPLLGQPRAWRRIVAAWAAGAAAMVLVCGWWFVRNQAEMGVPCLSHSGGGWWQDPGYRVPADLYRFGASLTRPVTQSARSVWDSLYGGFWGDAFGSGVLTRVAPPPWNLRLMLLTEWFALLPTALFFFGALPGRPDADLPARHVKVFAALGVGCFVAAVVNLYVTFPIYSCAKASYMMGATPCFAILLAAGYDRLPIPLRRPALACLVTGAMLGYATFFVID